MQEIPAGLEMRPRRVAGSAARHEHGAERKPGRARLPMFTSLRGYQAGWLRGYAIAGLTVRAVLRQRRWPRCGGSGCPGWAGSTASPKPSMQPRPGHRASKPRRVKLGQAIGGSLPPAVGIALSPIPIIAVVLMLTSRRAKVNGPAFILGWLIGLGIVGAIVLAVAGTGGASKSGSPATWVSWVKIVLGVLLLLVAVRQWAPGRRSYRPG